MSHAAPTDRFVESAWRCEREAGLLLALVGALGLSGICLPGCERRTTDESADATSDAAPATGSTPAAGAESAGATAADLLKAELDEVVEEAVAEQVRRSRTSGAVPPTREQVLEERERMTPGTTDVTPEQEALFRERGFDDAGNRSRVDAAGEVLMDFKVHLPLVGGYLNRAHRKAPLSGARLELLARLAGPASRLAEGRNLRPDHTATCREVIDHGRWRRARGPGERIAATRPRGEQ